MEQLEYLLKTLIHKRSNIESELKKQSNFREEQIETTGIIYGLNFAITEIYKLLSEDEES